MSRAYYNEFDKGAAAWLRELIKAGHIADGDVDERSIEDVLPSDLSGYTQCHFFAGIGGWSYALRLAGWTDDRPVWTGSCPCQPFSAAGQGAAFADERHLWPAFHHLIKERQPSVVFGEQVASKDADAWVDLVQTDLEAVDYAFWATPFPSASIGAPHIRDRLYWVAGRGVTQGDACGARLEGYGRGHQAESGRNRSVRPVAKAGEFGGVVDAGRARTRRNAGTASSEEAGVRGLWNPNGRDGCNAPVAAGAVRRLADHNGYGRHQAGECFAEAGNDGLVGNGSAGRLANAGNGSGQRCESRATERGLPASPGEYDPFRPGPTNGFWRDADWLFCRDGKWRPVEPGTFPLVDGLPRGMVPSSRIGMAIDANKTAEARVMRLRGYGNAINPVQAAMFVEAFMELAK